MAKIKQGLFRQIHSYPDCSAPSAVSFCQTPRPQQKMRYMSLPLRFQPYTVGGCVEIVKDAILGIQEVQTVEVNVVDRLVTVSHRDGGSVEGDVRERITEAGHMVGYPGISEETGERSEFPERLYK